MASAPVAFQKTIILTGLSGVGNYLDDFIFHGSDMSMNDKALQAVLQRLEAAGLQLNKDKCRFRQTSLLSFGHTVSVEGLLPDESCVQAIQNASPADKAVASAPVDEEFVAFLSTACNSLSAADVELHVLLVLL